MQGNHPFCSRCKSRAGELYHCDACFRSYHPHCSQVLQRSMRSTDTTLGNVASPWRCDVCQSLRCEIDFMPEADVHVTAHASATTIVDLLLRNMKHDATNRHVKSIHRALVQYGANRVAVPTPSATAPVRATTAARVTVSSVDLSGDAEEDENDEEDDDDDDDRAMASGRDPPNVLTGLLQKVQQMGDHIVQYSHRNDGPVAAPSGTTTIRCMAWGCTTGDGTGNRHRTYPDLWLCPSCRRVGVRIEILLTHRHRSAPFNHLATIQRVHPPGHTVDLLLDSGRVGTYRLDVFSWHVVELSLERRFINLSSLFTRDPIQLPVEHTHQDDLIHLFAILQHISSVDGPNAPDGYHTRNDDEEPRRIALGLHHHLQQPHHHDDADDARALVWPNHIDSRILVCGIAFNSMKGCYTSGRQLPLYQYTRLFRDRLCIWRTVARIADSAPNTSFEIAFADRIVPAYRTRHDKPSTRTRITRQRFTLCDAHDQPVLEWTYLIRHDPTVRCVTSDAIANSRVMLYNRDSGNVLVERLALLGVGLWDLEEEHQTTGRPDAGGSDESLGVGVRYLWQNFADPAYMRVLYDRLTPCCDALGRPVDDRPHLMLFAILLIKSLGDLGSACTVRSMNDRTVRTCQSLHRPTRLYNFVWTFDRHVSSLCAIITQGHVFFTPSVPSDNGLSIHGTFFQPTRWFDAICVKYRLDDVHADVANRVVVAQVVVQMLYHISEHLRGNVSFNTCQQRLRACCA